jgi:glycosyltransferase involved in cell wall biosynthesis
VGHSYVDRANHAKLRELAAIDGVRVRLIAPDYWPHPYHEYLLEPYGDGDLEVCALAGKNAGYADRWLPKKLAREIIHARPDVVHVEDEPRSRITPKALAAAREAKAATLVFTWENLPKRYGFMARWFRRRTFAMTDRFIAGNHDARDLLKRAGATAPIDVLPQYGVNLDDFNLSADDTAAAELGSAADRVTVAFFGRLVEAKGIFVLLDALAASEGSWDLVYVGDGPDRQALAEDISRKGLDATARIHGGVRHEEVPRYLAAVDILVLPSLTTPGWKEQFGRILVEAMAAGVPVVGSDSSEIPRVIAEAWTVVPEGDAATLAGAVDRLAGDPHLRSEFRRKGLDRVAASFTNRAIAHKTCAIYCEMLGIKGDAP